MLLFVSSKKKKIVYMIYVSPQLYPFWYLNTIKWLQQQLPLYWFIFLYLSPVFDDQDWHPTILYPVISPNE